MHDLQAEIGVNAGQHVIKHDAEPARKKRFRIPDRRRLYDIEKPEYKKGRDKIPQTPRDKRYGDQIPAELINNDMSAVLAEDLFRTVGSKSPHDDQQGNDKDQAGIGRLHQQNEQEAHRAAHCTRGIGEVS